MSHLVLKASARLAAATCATMAFIATARAADSFRYVSNSGDNANPCTLARPCRSLQKAISVTPVGGELHILDSGFYGNNATVNKSMTIVGNGHTVTLGASIIIDKANAVVTIRRLTLNGEGGITSGIQTPHAAKVHIEHCLIYGYTGAGISAFLQATKLLISDTTVRDNGGDGLFASGAGGATLTIGNSRFEHNGGSGVVAGGLSTSIIRSVADGNGNDGFSFSSSAANLTSSSAAHNTGYGFSAGVTTQMTLESVVSRGNATGLCACTASSITRISNSVFTNNTIGISNVGVTETPGNNILRGNGTALAGSALTAIGGI